jgi:hypothetical protein
MALDELDYALLDARVPGSVSSRLFLNLLVPVEGAPKQIATVRWLLYGHVVHII